MKWTFREFHTVILVGIFTINLTDGLTDGADDGHLMDGQSSGWSHISVDRQMSHATDIQMDLSCY